MSAQSLSISREEILAAYPLERVLDQYGIELSRQSGRLMCRCPFHADGTPSMSIDLAKGVWNCFSGCGGGSSIDFIARMSNEDPKATYGRLARELTGSMPTAPVATLKPKVDQHKPAAASPEKPADKWPTRKDSPTAVYTYQTLFGSLAYEVLRFERANPEKASGKDKTFRQRHKDKEGNWVYNMDGIERVLYRLPEITSSPVVWICEGEKDVDNLTALGIMATCNVGGAGKWLDGYTDSLAGKDIAICGDNDQPGKDHVELVFQSVSKKAKSVRLIRLPEAIKDASDFIATFETVDLAKKALEDLFHSATPFIQGHKIPLYSFVEMEQRYKFYIQKIEEQSFSLSGWLPALSPLRRLVPGDLVTFLAGTGVGKCLGKGTKIVRYDGSLVEVENVEVGDLLMGPDSKPRRVMALGRGSEEMFKITPRSGEPFTCNASHILSLKKTGGGEFCEISVAEYNQKSKKFKHLWKLWKAGVELPVARLDIPPYMLGLWLGDGTSSKPEITSGDVEIVRYVKDYAKSINCRTNITTGSGCVTIRITSRQTDYKKAKICNKCGAGHVLARGLCVRCYSYGKYHSKFTPYPKNAFYKGLTKLGLINSKRIPSVYQSSSREQRLELLAGIVDTDGYCPKRSCAIITTVSKDLADDYCLLARSLGFLTSVRIKKTSIRSTGYKGTAYNVTLCGDVHDIPTKLTRRRPAGSVQRKQKTSAFRVESIGRGEYYGFQLSGDGLFLLGDYTVTHNTSILTNIAIHARPIPTLFFELELPDASMFERFVGIECGMSGRQVEEGYKVQDEVGPAALQTRLGHVHICPEAAISISDLESIIVRSELKTGVKPQIVLLDYIQLMKGNGKSRYEQRSSVAEDLKSVAKSTQTIIILSSQIGRREEGEDPTVGLSDGKESGSIENSSGVVIGAWRDLEEPSVMIMRVLKATKGGAGIEVRCRYNLQSLRITQLESSTP